MRPLAGAQGHSQLDDNSHLPTLPGAAPRACSTPNEESGNSHVIETDRAAEEMESQLTGDPIAQRPLDSVVELDSNMTTLNITTTGGRPGQARVYQQVSHNMCLDLPAV